METVPPAVYPVIAGPLKGAFCDNRGYSDCKNAPGINEGDKATLLTVIGFESTSPAFSQTTLIEARVFLLQDVQIQRPEKTDRLKSLRSICGEREKKGESCLNFK
ncbi:hypothetical protein CDAR_592631 [Caerostris darwini]|uniref:Uncharacterized protein n=1 Tax=Caerostris darwini TaxID=1538125 RepID=A0AAV4QEK5_9ARAC|nr:hypothetical protein CDAR_592631 [Caerostris darwini]